MKYAVAVCAVAALLFCVQPAGAQGMVLGVSPTLGLNMAYFGVNAGTVVPMFGLLYGTASWETKSVYERHYGDPEDPDSIRKTISTDRTCVNAFLPMLGAKVYFGGDEMVEAGLRTYLNLMAMYSFGTSRMSSSYESPDTSWSRRDTASEKELNDLLTGNIGGFIGVGGEYFFSPDFSVNGEFGMQGFYVYDREVDERERETYKSVDIWEEKLGLGLTVARLGCNFYF